MTHAEFAAQLAELARNTGRPRVRPEPSGRAHALIEQAARLRHLAVQIHLILNGNGNGRWSRMLANIRLKQRSARVS